MLLSIADTLPDEIDRSVNMSEESVRWIPVLYSRRVLRPVDGYLLWYETEWWSRIFISFLSVHSTPLLDSWLISFIYMIPSISLVPLIASLS